MRKILFLIFLVTLISCSVNNHKGRYLVLSYEDFGPPVIASDVIGSDWWQWQTHGDSRPKKYDIKVVVYKGIMLAKIKKRYPVEPSKKQDYRYLDYYQALKYLDEHISENAVEAVTTKLITTKNKIFNTIN